MENIKELQTIAKNGQKMKLSTLILTLLISANCVMAQDAVVNTLKTESTTKTIKKEKDNSNWRWKKGGLLSFSASQGSLTNWAAGGDNFSLAANAYFNYFILFQNKNFNWDNNLDINLGYVQTTSLGSRKNDDRFDLLSKYGYKLDTSGKWLLSSLFNFRTQFFDGFSYNNNIADFSSAFLSPAYMLFSLGIDYKPSNKFSAFISPLTSRTTFIANDSLVKKGLYGVPVGSHSISDFGAFATINYANTLGKNITYKGRMDLFSNYKSKPQNVDLFMTNQFSFKINKYFSATYSLDLIYDDDVKLFGPNHDAPALQSKSIIGIGFLKVLDVKKK